MTDSLLSAGLGEPGGTAAAAAKGAARRGGRRSVRAAGGEGLRRSAPGRLPASEPPCAVSGAGGGKGGLDTEELSLGACQTAPCLGCD